jgi:hypothetical protein
MFNFKNITEDLIQGLEDMGEILGGGMIKDEMKKWKKDLEEWSEVNYDRIEQVQYSKFGIFLNSLSRSENCLWRFVGGMAVE